MCDIDSEREFGFRSFHDRPLLSIRQFNALGTYYLQVIRYSFPFISSSTVTAK